MTHIREYAEALPVHIGMKNGRLIIDALNEGGCNGTEVDLMDVIDWCFENINLFYYKDKSMFDLLVKLSNIR